MAEEILNLNELWSNTSKDIIIENIEQALSLRFPECVNFNDKIAKIMMCTDASLHTVYAWMNRSRENVKIPFLKLCALADELKIDVTEFLK